MHQSRLRALAGLHIHESRPVTIRVASCALRSVPHIFTAASSGLNGEFKLQFR